MSDLFTHPWMSGLFGDGEMAAILSPEAGLRAMLRVEETYLLARGDAGATGAGLAREAAAAIASLPVDIAALRAATAIDGLPVPGLIRQIKAALPAHLAAVVHDGLTSQDVMDTALILQLQAALTVLTERLGALEPALARLGEQHGARILMGRTRMQAALPIIVKDRVETWRLPLLAHQDRLAELKPRLLCLQLGGAVGDAAPFGPARAEIAAAMARRLDLAVPARAWHVMRDPLGEFGSWLSLLTGSLGKIGQDMALMAQQGIDEIRISGGGSSSAMPHKANPVRAELLVTLARYNATQLSGLHQALVAEQERSGAAWALEMMLLPGMLMATACALHTSLTLVQDIEKIGRV